MVLRAQGCKHRYPRINGPKLAGGSRRRKIYRGGDALCRHKRFKSMMPFNVLASSRPEHIEKPSNSQNGGVQRGEEKVLARYIFLLRKYRPHPSLINSATGGQQVVFPSRDVDRSFLTNNKGFRRKGSSTRALCRVLVIAAAR